MKAGKSTLQYYVKFTTEQSGVIPSEKKKVFVRVATTIYFRNLKRSLAFSKSYLRNTIVNIVLRLAWA